MNRMKVNRRIQERSDMTGAEWLSSNDASSLLQVVQRSRPSKR
jgi:hypothetical protein